MKFTCLSDCVYCFCCYFAVIIFFKRFTVDGCVHITCVHIISKRLRTPARRSVNASTLSQKFAHLKKSCQHIDQMPFFENTTILCRDPHDFDNYSTMKIEIAFILNLERPITATQCFHFEKQKNPFSILILEEISFKKL